MRIALVHDYLVQYGGAERVLECFSELFPYAPIYTLVYDKEAMHGVFGGKDIRTSYLQKIPFASKQHRLFPPLMPSAVEQFDFSKYDVVLSDSSSYAKGIITGPETLHICYMHTPMRYAWDDCQKYTADFGFPHLIKKVIPYFMNYIRLWDKLSADRVDKFIANSNFVAKRIKKYYGKNSEVINPPVSINNFYVSENQKGYFLMVGRLIAYKRHDTAIEAFNKLGLPLKIIGRGPEMKRLKKMATSNIEFLNRIPDEELAKYYSECQAFVFPQEEDFGIVAIEAFASGRPVIAFRGGDIPEHMDEKMGIFFEKQTPEDIIKAVKKFNSANFDKNYIRSKSLRFDKEIFKGKIKEYVERELENFKL
ncbi:MAG: glycosyltransferase [Patescibacteria group bacterium]